MILFIDHNDSFSNNLTSWFLAKSLPLKVISYEHLTSDYQFNNEIAVIFSPGPGHPSDYPKSLRLLQNLPPAIPFLGICLGHQLLISYYGGKIEQIQETPIHGRQIFCQQRQASRYIKKEELEGLFVLYNSLGCKINDPIFQQSMLALAVEESVVLATEHTTYPRIGLQFHPESFASPGGNNILLSFLRLIKC